MSNVNAVIQTSAPTIPRPVLKRVLSAEVKAKISASQRKRWETVRMIKLGTWHSIVPAALINRERTSNCGRTDSIHVMQGAVARR
jgi:hypothetical protein